MSRSHITLASGELIETEELVDASLLNVNRQTVQIGGSALGEVADVKGAAPAGSENGVVVRNIPSGTQDVNVVASSGGGLTDAELRATPVPVSGPLTDTELRATPVPVSGAVSVSGSVAVTGPLTDTELRATAVPVDGSGVTQPVSAAALPLPTGAAIAANQQTDALTDTELRAADVKVTLDGETVAIASLPSIPAGTNNIGDVDVLTLPALPAGTNNIGDVDVLTQPARAATTDAVTAKLATDAIQNGLTALTPKFVAIAAATSGDNTILSAVSGKKIRVLAMNFVLAAATNVYVKDGAGTVLWAGSTNTANFAANGGIVLPFCPVGWFETAAAQALVINLSAANKCGGSIVYVEV